MLDQGQDQGQGQVTPDRENVSDDSQETVSDVAVFPSQGPTVSKADSFEQDLLDEGETLSSDSSSDFDLSEFDEDFEEAEALSFSMIPNGTYQVKVSKVFLDVSSSGNKMLRWELEIVSGEFKGSNLKKHSMIMTKDNLRFLKNDLEKAGTDMSPKLSQMTMPSALKALLDNVIEISVKNQKDNPPNIYFNKLIRTGVDENEELPF